MSRTLGDLIALLPERVYLKCQVELDEEEDEKFLSAVLMEAPPDDGWTIPTYFDEPPGVKRAHDEAWLERFRHDDVARIGTSASHDDPASFNRLTISMIESFLKKKGLLPPEEKPKVRSFPEEMEKYPEEWVVLSTDEPTKLLGHGKSPAEAIKSAAVDPMNHRLWTLYYHDGETGLRV
jgi:hypothetical protein